MAAMIAVEFAPSGFLLIVDNALHEQQSRGALCGGKTWVMRLHTHDKQAGLYFVVSTTTADFRRGAGLPYVIPLCLKQQDYDVRAGLLSGSCVSHCVEKHSPTKTMSCLRWSSAAE